MACFMNEVAKIPTKLVGIWLNFHELNQNPNAMLRLLRMEGIPKKTKGYKLTRSLIHSFGV